jgi:hypothetical protein
MSECESGPDTISRVLSAYDLGVKLRLRKTLALTELGKHTWLPTRPGGDNANRYSGNAVTTPEATWKWEAIERDALGKPVKGTVPRQRDANWQQAENADDTDGQGTAGAAPRRHRE